jgi:Holliday junction resolvase
MNSRTKGKVGEREFASFLREHGIDARRGQQFSGSNESPDVVAALPYHIEVKRVERLNLMSACQQAARDSEGKPWIVAHRVNHGEWMVTLRAEEFLKLMKDHE